MFFTKKIFLKSKFSKDCRRMSFFAIAFVLFFFQEIKATAAYEQKSIYNTPVIEMIDSAVVCYASPFRVHPNVSYYDSLLWETNGYGHFSQTTVINPIYFPSLADSAAGFIKIYLTAFSSYGHTKDSLLLQLTTKAVAYAGPDVEMCEGDNVQLFASGGSTYQWNYPLSMCCPAIHNPIAWPPSTRTYIVTIGSPCGIASDSVTVFVNPKPQINISSQGPIFFCSGDSIKLTAPFINSYTYTWFHNSSPIPSSADTSHYATESGLYKVFVTDTLGCSNFSNILTVDALPLPTATINTSDSTAFCPGDSLIIFINTDTTNTYRWYKNNNLMLGCDNQPLTVYDSAFFHAVVTDTAGCYIHTPLIETVLLPTPPQPTITFANDTLLSSAPTGNQWFKNSQEIIGATGAAFFPVETGTYTVQVKSDYGCFSEMSEPFFFTGIDKKKPSKNTNINIFPNPAKETLYILFSNHKTVYALINIYNSQGQLLRSKEVSGISGITNVSLEGLSSGVYIFEVLTEKEIHHKRIIVKQH